MITQQNVMFLNQGLFFINKHRLFDPLLISK